MRLVDHFIVGGTGGLAQGRRAAVMDPNNGGQQAEVVLGSADALERAVTAAQAAQPAWAALPMAERLACIQRFRAGLVAELDALAAAIDRLAGDPALRRQYGEAGRQRILAEFSIDRMVDGNLALYHQVLGR